MLTYQIDLLFIACFLKKNISCPFAMKSISQCFIYLFIVYFPQWCSYLILTQRPLPFFPLEEP